MVSNTCRETSTFLPSVVSPTIEASFLFLQHAEKVQTGSFLEASALIYPEAQEGDMLDLPTEKQAIPRPRPTYSSNFILFLLLCLLPTCPVTGITEVNKGATLCEDIQRRGSLCSACVLGTQLHSEQMLLVGQRSRACHILSCHTWHSSRWGAATFPSHRIKPPLPSTPCLRRSTHYFEAKGYKEKQHHC